MNPQNDNTDQRNLLLAVGLCIVLMLVWPHDPPVGPPKDTADENQVEAPVGETPSNTSPTSGEAGSNTEGASASTPNTPQKAPAPEAPTKPSFEPQDYEELKIPGEHGVVLSTAGGAIARWTLYEEQYQVQVEGEDPRPFSFVDLAPESKKEDLPATDGPLDHRRADSRRR